MRMVTHHNQHTSLPLLEVDMASYDETTEYEMLDESAQPIQHEPVDAEVVDVSFHDFAAAIAYGSRFFYK